MVGLTGPLVADPKGDASCRQGCRRGGELGVQVSLVEVTDQASNLRQGLASQVVRVRCLFLGSLRVDVDEFADEFGFHGDHRQALAEKVMDVGGDPLPLGIGGLDLVLLVLLESVVAPHPPDASGQQNHGH